jgi:F0F1-type ATP synthase assembly protein I
MPKNDRKPSLARSLRALQETAVRSGPAAMASYTLLGAIILLGGLGYAIDQWQGTAPWGLVIGLAVGLAAGFYQLAKAVFRPR